MNHNQDYNAKNIEMLEGLEAVYKRPGMYIGSTDEKGCQHCFIEILDNSVDEHNAGYCNKIDVELFEDDSIVISDNGRGIPVDIHPVYGVSAATLVVTELHAGGKFGGENSSYHRTGGLHGVGASVVNALSDWFEMTIYREGKVYFQRFELKKENGKTIPAQAVEPLKVIGSCDTGKTGTSIRFKLNQEKFSSKIYNESKDEFEVEYYGFNPSQIMGKLELLSFLNPALELTFINHKNKELISLIRDKDKNNGKAILSDYLQSNIFSFEKTDDNVKLIWKSDNVIDYLEVLGKTMEDKITEPFAFEKEVPPKKGSDKGNIFVRIAMQWFSGEESKVNGFVNNIYTPLAGTHVTGFRKALNRTLSQYVENYASDKDKKDFSGTGISDMEEGLAAIVSIKIAEPQFEGQTKEKLSSKEADSAVYFASCEFLTKHFEQNPRFAKDIVTRVLRAKRAREAAARARKASVIDKNNSGFSTPSKLADCQSKNPEMCELFLVEGDSAGGSAKMARDKKYQAILPLKGKISNVHDMENNKVLASSEINSIISTLGCGIGKNFDIEKLRYHKIIYMTDADDDGKHIRTLLSTFFHKYFPELIKNNHIYVAIAPLYRLKRKKGNFPPVYLKDDDALNQFKQENNMDLWDVNRFKGLGEMNPDQLKETTMCPETRELGLLQYDGETEDEISDVFYRLMGNDPDTRKEFLKNYR